MTEAQLDTAREFVDAYTKALGYEKPNLRFELGFIECLDKVPGLPPAHLVISNCVLNLSPDKESVLRGAHAALREGGEMHFSDIYCDRRLPADVRAHPVLFGECIAGSMYIEDFLRVCRRVGFADPRRLASSEVQIESEELREVVGAARFYSIT
jgi:arsenite methyltransferase